MKTILGTLRPANLTLEFKKTLISLSLLVCIVATAGAATKTWTNGGGTNNWGDASNWSTAGVPGAADAVVFNSTYPANCNMNVQVSVASITVSTGYTGTITQMAGDSLLVSGNVSMAAGNFIGGNKRIDINGGLTVGTANFTSTTGALYIQTNFIVNIGGVFYHNNGTIYFDQAGTTTITLASNAATYFYNVVFNSSVGTTITAQDTMVVTNTLSLLQNQVKTGVIRMVLGSNLVTAPAFTGGNAILDVQAPITVTPAGTAFCGVNLNHASAVFNAPASALAMNGPVNVYLGTFNGGTNPINFNSTFKQTGGTYTATTGTTTYESTFTFTGGTYNHSNGLTAFTLVSTNFTNGGKMSFYDVNINKAVAANTMTLAATDTLKTDNSLTLTMGTVNGGYMMPNGSGLTITSNYGGGTSLLLVTAPYTYSVPAGYNIPGMTINNPSAIINFGSGVTPVFKGAVVLKNGTFNCNSTPWNMTQQLTISGGTFNASTATTTYDNAALIISTGATFNHNNGTFSFNRSAGTVTITNTLKTTFYDVIINLTNATAANKVFTVATADTIIVANSLRLQSGYINTGVVELRGSLNDYGTFSGGTGQLVIANGTGSRNINFASPTYPIVKINDAQATVTAPTSNTITYSGVFQLLAGDYFPDAYATVFTGAYTQSGGTFWNGTANVTHTSTTAITGGDYHPTSATTLFTGSYSQSGGTFYQTNGNINHTSSLTFSGGNYNPSTGTTTLTGAFSQTGGVFQSGGGTMNFNSNFTLATGTFNPPSGVMTVTGTATITSGTYTSAAARQVFNGVLNINGGNFTSTSDTTVIGNSAMNIAAVATFNHNNGTYLFNRSAGGSTITDGKKELFNNIVVNLTNVTPASARFTITSADTVVTLGTLALTAGNLYTGGILEARGSIVDGGSFGGGTGLLTVANGAGSRTLNFTSALLPGMIINDATATVNVASTQATTIGAALAVRGGIFNPGSNALTVTGAYSQSGGTFAAGTAPITLNSTYAMTGGTFNPSSALTIITGAYTQTSGVVATGSAKLSLRNTVSVTGGTLNSPTDTLEIAGSSLYVLAGTFVHNNGTLSFNNATQSCSFTPPVSFNVYNLHVNLSHATANILTIAAGDTVIVANKAAFVAGKINTGMVELKKDISNVTTFGGGNATLIISNGTGARSMTMPGTTLCNMVINDANVTVNGPTTGTLALQGNLLIQKGTYTGGAGNVTIAGTYNQTGGTFTGGAGNVSVANTFAVSGTGTAFTAPSGSLSFASTLSITSPATFAHNNGTLISTGGVTQTLSYTTAGNLTLNNLTINNTGNTELRPSITTGNLILAGSLNIAAAGALNISFNSEDLTIGGSYNDLNATGGLVYGTRTVTFNGSSAQTLTGAGTETFYNLVMSNPGTLSIGGTTPVNVTNLLTLSPGSTAKMKIGNGSVTIKTGATISGGTSTEFFVTDGAGYLRQENIGSTGRTGNILFPVGSSTASYTPVTLKNTGTNDRFDVNLLPQAYTNGLTGPVVTNSALNKTFNIEEQTVGGSNVTITLQWNASDELVGLDRTACAIKHYSSGIWFKEGLFQVAGGSGPYTATAAGITSFSPFDVGSGGGSLPVELASFTGSIDDNSKVALNWVTEIEINNNNFTLERAADGENFTELVTVQGAGNSTIEQHYSYVDANPIVGTGYYRLKQTDFDGQFKYVGNIVAINNKKASTSTMTVSPNPLEGSEVTVNLTGADDLTSKVTVDVMDISGKNVYHNDLSPASRMTISLPDALAKGMYFMQVNAGTEVYKQKLIVR